MNNFSQDDLIQYLYNETSAEKTQAIKAALETDWSLREAMEVLKISHEQLDEIKMVSPRTQTLDNIFAYAEKSLVELHA